VVKDTAFQLAVIQSTVCSSINHRELNLENQEFLQMIARTHLGFAAGAIAELGIADLIPRGAARPVTELAAEGGCDAALLYRTLRFLASYGIFEETAPRSFALTSAADAMRSDAPESTRGGWRMVHGIFRAQQGLEESLRTGRTPFVNSFGQPIFAYLGSHPEDAAIFDAGMTSFHGPETAAMLKAYDLSGIGTLADIGGGNGSLLIPTLSRYPNLKGLLFDVGHVIDRARSNIHAAGLTDRCRIEQGSFFESIPQGADAYLLRHIIHDWTDEQSVAILKNCRRVMPANGRLLIVEAVVPPGNHPSAAKDFDFLMLMYPGGMERTADEYRALFQAAGFELSSITPTESPVSVIEGHPA
jgi:hypothetical protein